MKGGTRSGLPYQILQSESRERGASWWSIFLACYFFFFFCLFPTRDMVPPTCKADPLSQLNSGDTLTDIPKVCLLDDPKRN